MFAFSAFNMLILSTIFSIFFVDLLNWIGSFALLLLLFSSDDDAMSWGLLVCGLIELVYMKSVGSSLAMISLELPFVGSALTL